MLDLEMDKRTTGEQAADALRAEILSGRIADGTEINQAEVAQSFGLSRMPVREALRQLEGEGLIERLDNRHTRVIGMNKETRSSRFDLLAEIMTLAVASLNREDIGRLTVLWQGTQNEAQAHVAFHNHVFALCQDRFLRQMYQRVFFGFLAYCLQHAHALPGKTRMAQALKSADKGARDALHHALTQYYVRINDMLGKE
ncbi:MAG: GntR family transcriptional regulator [Clostridia bacterium]